MTHVLKLADRPAISGGEGVETRTIVGDGAMLNLTLMRPGAQIEPHDHHHEQVGIVLEGSVTLTVDGAEHALGPGHAYHVSGGSQHALRAGPGGARLVDTFHPVREDYRAVAGADDRGEVS